ncbi:MAG: phage tail tape measure protein [Oscillospiraceae bacterium]|nr:phage tail tape measure protein [Oscillospiraceae bacterium]
MGVSILYSAAEKYVTGVINQKEAEATRGAYDTYMRLLREYYATRIQEIREGKSNTDSSAILEKADSVYAAIGSMGLTDKTLDTSVEKLKTERDLMVGKVELYTKLENAIKEYNAERIKLLGMDVEAEGYSEQQKYVQELLDSVSNLKRVANDPENALYNKGMEKNAQALERQMDAEYKTAQKRITLQNNINNWRTKNERAAHVYADNIREIEEEIADAQGDALEKLNDRFSSINAEAQSRGLKGRNPTAQEIANNITSAEMLMGKLNQLLAGASGKAFTEFDTEIERTKLAITAAMDEVWGVDDKFIGGNPETLKEAKRQLKELTTQFEQAGYKGKNAFTNIDKAARGLFNLFGGGIIISQIKSQFTDAYQSIVMLDSAFANIRMTMSMSNAEMRELGDNSIQLSKKLGITLDSVMQAATIYANENISINDIIARAEPTALLASAANMEATAAADLIQGVVYQFDLDDSAESLMRVVDSIEAISAATGVEFKRSIEQISEGIQASGAIAHASGYSYQEFAAQIGNLVERTRRSGSEVANGLKMIFARLGQNLEGDATEEEISKAEKAYASLGIALRDGTDDFRDLPDVFEELSVKWQTMTDTEKAYIAEVSAGNRNRSVFMSMMDGYASTLGLVETAEQSAGFALEANADRMDAYEAKLGKLKATLESFYNNLVDTTGLEIAVEGLTTIAEGVDTLTNKIPVLSDAVRALGAGFIALSIPNIVNELKQSQSGLGAVLRAVTGNHEKANAVKEAIRNKGAEWAAKIEEKRQQKQANKEQQESIIIKTKTIAVNNAVTKSERTFGDTLDDTTKDINENSAALDNNSKKIRENMMLNEAAENVNKNDVNTPTAPTNKTGDAGILAALGLTKANIIAALVTVAITLIIGGINKAIEKQEELRQEYEDTLNVVAQSTKEYANNNKSMKDTADELHKLIPIYESLSKGVNSYGHNISLSAEAYETYKDTVTRIAELSPDLVAGHNNEQLALLSVAKAAGNAADEYARMAKNAALASAKDTMDNAQTVLTGSFDTPNNVTLYDKYDASEELLQAFKDTQNGILVNHNSWGEITPLAQFIEMSMRGVASSDGDIAKVYREVLDDLGVSSMDEITLSEIEALVKQYKDEVFLVNQGVKLALSTQLESNDEYYKLSESARSMVSSIVDSLSQDKDFLADATNNINNISVAAVKIINAVDNSELVSLYNQMNTLNKQLNENKIGYQDYLDAMYDISTQANAIATEEGVDVSTLFDFSVQQGMFDEYTEQIIKEYKASLQRAFEAENPEPKSIFNSEDPVPDSEILNPFNQDEINTERKKYNTWIERGKDYISGLWNSELEEHINNLPANKLSFAAEMDIDPTWDIEEFDAELEKQMAKAQEKRQVEFNLLDAGNQEHINTYIESLEKVSTLAKGAEMSSAELLQFMMQFPDFDWERYGITGEEGVGDFGAAAIAMAGTALDDLMLMLPDADDATIKLFKDMAATAREAADEIDGITEAIDKASSFKDTMKSVDSDLAKYGRLTADTLKSIVSDIPEMEDAVRDYILGNIEQEAFLNEYKNKQKLAQDELYYKLVGKLDAAAVNYMKDNYGVDLSNCKNYLDAKLELYKQLVVANEIYGKYISESGKADFAGLFNDTGSDSDMAYLSQLRVKYLTALNDLFGTLDGSYEGIFADLFAPEEMEEVNNILSEMVSLYDQIFSGIKNVAELRIESLEAEKEALEEKNEEEQKEIDLIKAKQQLEDARNNKVIREYHEGQGFIWAADQKAIAEAEENLAETEKNAQVDAIDKQIEAINKYVDSIDDITEAVERQKNISAAMSYLGITNPEELLSLSDEQIKSFAANYQSLSLASDKKDNAEKISQYATLTDEQIAQMFGSNFGITMQNLINSWDGSYFIPDVVQQFVETEKKAIEAAKASAETGTTETPTQRNIYIENINVTYSGDSFEEILHEATRYAYTH